MDTSPLVRKTYVVLLGQAAQAAGVAAAVVQQAASCLAALLRDASPMVVKACMVAYLPVLRAGLALLAAQVRLPSLCIPTHWGRDRHRERRRDHPPHPHR